MSDDLIERLTLWGQGRALASHFLGKTSAKETCAEAADELTRLRARIEAADKLAEAVRPHVSPVQNADYARQLRQHNALIAALSAYEGDKG